MPPKKRPALDSSISSQSGLSSISETSSFRQSQDDDESDGYSSPESSDSTEQDSEYVSENEDEFMEPDITPAEVKKALKLEGFDTLSPSQLYGKLKISLRHLHSLVLKTYEERKRLFPPKKKTDDGQRSLYAMESDIPKINWIFDELDELAVNMPTIEEDIYRAAIIIFITEFIDVQNKELSNCKDISSFDPGYVLDSLLDYVEMCFKEVHLLYASNFSLGLSGSEDEDYSDEESDEEESMEEENDSLIIDISDIVETDDEIKCDNKTLKENAYQGFKVLFEEYHNYLKRVDIKINIDIITDSPKMAFGYTMVSKLFEFIHKAFTIISSKPEKKANRNRTVYLTRAALILKNDMVLQGGKEYLTTFGIKLENVFRALEMGKLENDYDDWKLETVKNLGIEDQLDNQSSSDDESSSDELSEDDDKQIIKEKKNQPRRIVKVPRKKVQK